MEVFPVNWKITYVWCGGIDAMPCERVFDDYAEAMEEYERMKRDPNMFQCLERPHVITGKSMPLAQVTTRANRLCRAEMFLTDELSENIRQNAKTISADVDALLKNVNFQADLLSVRARAKYDLARRHTVATLENDSLKKLLLALSDMVRFADSSYTGDGIKPLVDWLSDTAHLYEKKR